MTDIEEVYVQDLYNKHNGKELFKGFYTVGKKIYQDDGNTKNECFALDRENLEILRARIMAILIDDYPVNGEKSKNNENPKEFTQTNLC